MAITEEEHVVGIVSNRDVFGVLAEDAPAARQRTFASTGAVQGERLSPGADG